MMNVSYSGNNHKEARSSSRPYISCNVLSINEYHKAVDLNERSAKTLSVTFFVYLERFGRRREGRIWVHVS
jgi:hypothetical protein